MQARIEFFDDLEEEVVPEIILTRSKNKQTGTATFLFLNPISLNKVILELLPIENLFLKWEEGNKHKQISTNKLSIIIQDQKPFVLKAIFIFKNPKEWFEFFSFMSYYSKQTGLSFLEKDPNM